MLSCFESQGADVVLLYRPSINKTQGTHFISMNICSWKRGKVHTKKHESVHEKRETLPPLNLVFSGFSSFLTRCFTDPILMCRSRSLWTLARENVKLLDTKAIFFCLECECIKYVDFTVICLFKKISEKDIFQSGKAGPGGKRYFPHESSNVNTHARDPR